MTHSMTDSQAFYDKQLSKIGSIVKESVGVETKPIQLVTKTLPTIEHCVGSYFGVIKEFCGGRRQTLMVGTGQVNACSVSMFRDSSCMMLKEIEKENLGVFIKLPLTTDSVQQLAIAFVDDDDFASDEKR